MELPATVLTVGKRLQLANVNTAVNTFSFPVTNVFQTVLRKLDNRIAFWLANDAGAMPDLRARLRGDTSAGGIMIGSGNLNFLMDWEHYGSLVQKEWQFRVTGVGITVNFYELLYIGV